MEFTDENENEIYDIGEPFFLANSDQVYEGIDLGSYVPTGKQPFNDTDSDSIRDELLECVDKYFETSSEIIFRYKYVNGNYNQNIYNQEFNLPPQCSDNDGYRTITISVNDATVNSCFNSCSSSCDD